MTQLRFLQRLAATESCRAASHHNALLPRHGGQSCCVMWCCTVITIYSSPRTLWRDTDKPRSYRQWTSGRDKNPPATPTPIIVSPRGQDTSYLPASKSSLASLLAAAKTETGLVNPSQKCRSVGGTFEDGVSNRSIGVRKDQACLHQISPANLSSCHLPLATCHCQCFPPFHSTFLFDPEHDFINKDQD